MKFFLAQCFLNRIDELVDSGLQIHLVLDNYGTHKHPAVKKWLAVRPRYHVHFTPTSSSWLNQIERWFAEITRKRIRRGTFRSVRDLTKAIQDYIQCYNRNPRPFQWVASASKIIRKVNKYKETLETGDFRSSFSPIQEGGCTACFRVSDTRCGTCVILPAFLQSRCSPSQLSYTPTVTL